MSTHPSPSVIARYADRASGLDEAGVWSVEVHLEECAECRAVLAGRTADDTRDLLARIAAGVGEGITAGPAPAPPRLLSSVGNRWLIWRLVPWLIMTVTALGCALLIQALLPAFPSLIMLVAPVAPLPGVAIAWSRRHDPAWELIAGTPAAGPAMLLRRTAVVLALIVPVLALFSARTGVSLALTLLPSLAFTAATIALGAVIGVRRAAIGLGTAWAAAVVAPTALTADLPVVLQPHSTPWWALLTVALAAFAATRADNFRQLPSRD